jgi:diguanylate cyclase (GGDEF)-like protein
MEISLQRLARREWWLWSFSIAITALSAAAVLLSLFPRLFAHTDRFYEITAAQARCASFGFLLLFNAWMIYRQWSFRRLRSVLRGSEYSGTQSNASAAAPHDSFRIDPLTELCTRASFEHLLGKQIAGSRRSKAALSLVAIRIDDFVQFGQRFGAAAAELVVKEFAKRIKKASRGIDFAVRLESDGFLLALPECGLNDAKRVLDRLGDLEMDASGAEVLLTHSTVWINYKPGDVPSDLIGRAEQVLQLYKKASTASTPAFGPAAKSRA